MLTTVKVGVLNKPYHYLIWICSLAVDMNNTDEASLYCTVDVLKL
jgi:hypothetical protein